jgi:hypothetical protein
MATCAIPDCGRNALNNFGVRLRLPPQSDAWWSPNTNTFICDHHARSGARITVVYEATDTSRIETRVYAVAEEPIVRRTGITP